MFQSKRIYLEEGPLDHHIHPTEIFKLVPTGLQFRVLRRDIALMHEKVYYQGVRYINAGDGGQPHRTFLVISYIHQFIEFLMVVIGHVEEAKEGQVAPTPEVGSGVLPLEPYLLPLRVYHLQAILVFIVYHWFIVEGFLI